jgi:colanic acid biosynthesis glycosyl transferase WcaI
VAFIFINRYFHPDHSATSQMLSPLAFALAARGDTVHVVTSRQRYDAPGDSLPAIETIDGVRIHRIWTTRFGRSNLAGRALDYLTFYLSAAVMTGRLAGRGDVVIAKTDPPMMSVIAGPVARLKGAKLVNWLQDVFPEIAMAAGLGTGAVGRAGYGFLQALRNRSLVGAAMTVAVGERMAEHVTRFGVPAARVRVIANWADGDLIVPVSMAVNALRREWGLEDAFVVGYSGNLGRAHEYETFLDAIGRLERRAAGNAARPVVWLFVGGGALYGQMAAEVARRGLHSVRFQPYQPRERLAQSLSAADVHLVSLRPQLEGLVVPSKYYGIAAAGRPAIFVGDSDGEIARCLARDATGLTVAPGDGAGLADTIERLATDPDAAAQMGERARAAFDREFSRARAIWQWTTLLDQVARG